MKKDDVKIGETYLTRIGDSIAPVVVTGVARRNFSYTLAQETGPLRWYVRRIGEDRNLPKSRTAASLRPVGVRTYKTPEGLVAEVRVDYMAPEGQRGYVVDVTYNGEKLPRQFARDIDHPQVAAARAIYALMAQAMFG